MTDYRPLILTARFDPHAQALFQRLRETHFPRERNIVPAHLTLFHHLPGGELAAISDWLSMTARAVSVLDVAVPGLRSLGRGVAFAIRSDTLEDLRAQLAETWHGLLIPQDRQGWRPHVTIQNKVEPAVAKALLETLSRDFKPWRCRILGLSLWRYLEGPWEAVREFRFRGPS